MISKSTKKKVVDKILVLENINLFQPVKEESLFKQMEEYISRSRLKTLIKELNKNKFITSEEGWYRTSYKGYRFSVSRRASMLRDIHRMKHLIDYFQQRGGGYVGR